MDDETYVPSAKWTDFLGWGGNGRPDEGDLAEAFHEASKNLPSVLPAPSAGVDPESDPLARATIGRPGKRHLALPTVALPGPDYPDAAFERALRERRSRRHFGEAPVSLRDLSTLLHAAYGATGQGESGQEPRRTRSVPSGGALYPLDIYVVARNVDGLAAGLYHYDPLRQMLEVMREEETTGRLGELLIRLEGLPDVATTCGVAVFVVGAFWRTRFKYGLRGYRWVLIEAGHLGQNLVLAAEVLGLSAVPYGGIWDRRVDEFLGIDGVNESVVYSLVAGAPAPGAGRDQASSF